ncbi:hypothetical protein BRC76_08190 [Halobacteriales archaeon QH_8_67_36]|nr:MAG: hypothetical protein BRC76_08190 [Halobacteriales archaeon QH_8_67_36]
MTRDIRRPEHTGENRCWPCTTVNLGLVGLLVLWLYRRDRRVGAAAIAVAGVAAVAVRGYVVPYTPKFAPRLVEALPLPGEVFGKDTHRELPESASLTGTELDGTTVLQELAAAGAIEAEGELIRPTAAVDDAWRESMDRLAAEPLDALAREVAATLPTLGAVDSYEDDGEWLVVDGGLVARPVAVAELAAYRALADSVTDQRIRLAGARAFRMFLESCPVCGTALAESSAVSCCGGYTDLQTAPEEILVCPACEQRLFTVPT